MVSTSPLGLGEGAVGDLPYEIAAKPPALALHDEDLLVDEAAEGFGEVVHAVHVLGHPLERRDRTGTAPHRGVLDGRSLGRSEAVDARRDQAAKGVGELGQHRLDDLDARAGGGRLALEQRHELLEEERVATAAVEQRGAQRRVELALHERLEQGSRAVAVERIEVDHHHVVAARRHPPALVDGLASRGHQHEAAAGEAIEERVDHPEDEVVGPVQVGEHEHHRSAAGHRLEVGQHRPVGFLAGARRIDALEGDVVAHQVQQPVDDALDLGGADRLLEDRRDLSPRASIGVGEGGVGVHAGGLADGLGDGPPHVGLAVGDAAALEDEGVVALPRRRRGFLGEPRLADTRLAHEQQQMGAVAGHRSLRRPGQQAQLHLPTDERRLDPTPAVAGREQRLDRHPRRHRLLAALGGDGPEAPIGDHLPRRRVGRRPDDHGAGLGGRLQPIGGVHDVAHGRVLAPGPQRSDQDLAGVDAHPQAHRAIGLGRGGGEGRLHPQRGPHCPLGIVLVGDRRSEQGQDGVAHDLVDLAAERGDVGGEPLEAAVDQVLDLLGVAQLRQGREPDQVGEQDGDHPTLVTT
ncbi:MAG: hypothetical protein R2726_11175 [Acidimicrobiales bacterium]